MMTKQELIQKILNMIEEEEKQSRTLTDSLAIDNLMGLVDDIEQLCREQLEGKR